MEAHFQRQVVILNDVKNKTAKLCDIKSHIKQRQRTWLQREADVKRFKKSDIHWLCRCVQCNGTRLLVRKIAFTVQRRLETHYAPRINHSWITESQITQHLFCHIFINVKPKAPALNSNNFHVCPFDTTVNTFHVVANPRVNASGVCTARRDNVWWQWGYYELWVDEEQEINRSALWISRKKLNKRI
jgi:hypothetical protein